MSLGKLSQCFIDNIKSFNDTNAVSLSPVNLGLKLALKNLGNL